MAEFTFTIPNRYDETMATEGVWIEASDWKDQHWGDFKLVLFDPESPALKKAAEAARRRYAKEIRTKDENAEKLVAIETVIQCILIDWKGVKDGKGKEVPFSKEAARAYFMVPHVYKFVFNYIVSASQDLSNFDVVDKDDVLGN